MSDIFALDDKKERPVAGRRALGGNASASAMSSPPESLKSTDTGEKPVLRQGGWNESNTSTHEDPRLKSESDAAVVETIPSIPVLEDLADEDMSFAVAEAPNVQVNRLTTIRELDQDLHKHSAMMMLDGKIDLKLITRFLNAESDIVEEDKPWQWDRLFTEVASDLNSEWESISEVETIESR